MGSQPPVLIINPGSTSTKLGVSIGGELTHSETIHHSMEELRAFPGVWAQFELRLALSRDWARKHAGAYAAVVAMGGLLRPVEGGTYRVTAQMLEDARSNFQGEHASNLGCALAHELARDYDCPAYIVDPVSVDEFEPLARYSGHPLIERRSLSHALSIHAVARRAAEQMGIAFAHSRFVVCHLGGGISIAPVRGGKIIDVNDAASDGPFSPERTGGLPLQPFIGLCFSGEYGESEMRRMVMGQGGLVAYLGTNSAAEVESRIEKGDARAREVFEAMAYQIAKEIGAMATVLHGRVDAIILTGGLAQSTKVVDWIRERVEYIAPLRVDAGDVEMEALAAGAWRVINGEEQVKEY